jgi:hypothetical protein
MKTKREGNHIAFRAALVRDLEDFGRLLVDYGVCPDPSPLEVAGNACRGLSGNRWGYSYSGLILRVGSDVKCIPSDIGDLTCRLDVSVEGVCDQEGTFNDPLGVHQMQIQLKASRKGSSSAFMQSWHFDRHQDSATANPPIPAHPCYHFSFGGHALKHHLTASGLSHFEGFLLLDSPRLPHPPFDGILAIDFALSNFAGTEWRILREIPEYQRIVQAAQQRLWQPYVRALYEHWWGDTATRKVWPVARIWPHAF